MHMILVDHCYSTCSLFARVVRKIYDTIVTVPWQPGTQFSNRSVCVLIFTQGSRTHRTTTFRYRDRYRVLTPSLDGFRGSEDFTQVQVVYKKGS
jgi:hypothetical protein